MTKPISYKSTIMACYIGVFSQAIIINLTPILFIPLREQFGFTFAQLGALVLINFLAQVAIDIGFSGFVDRIGFRPLIVPAYIFMVVGLIFFALVPRMPIAPYTGFVIATILFSAAGGLMELLLSPIINAIPTDEKAAAMSILHSFYCWGQVSVALLTTLFLFVFGKQSWPIIAALWAILPVINTFLFMRCPLAPPVSEENRQPVREIMKSPFFVIFLLAIACGGASELSISQWTSTFMETALGISKVIGDTAGMCMFAAMMGSGRLIYGILGSRLNLRKTMIIGSFAAVVCYLTVALSPIPILGLVACAICGLGVSLLWPGSLSLATERFPLAGSWMFALMAAAGDIGGSIGPWFMGFVADNMPNLSTFMSQEQFGLRAAMLISAIFPLGALICVWLTGRHQKQNV